jgi:hypothetical protein
MTIAEELFELIEDQATANTRTSIPGVIESYDSSDQTCTVKPSINTPIKDSETGEVIYDEPPIIPNCPVAWSSSADTSITWPISDGDTCMIVFSEKSIDGWMEQGGDNIDPVDLRQHDTSDAIVFPVLRPAAEPLDSDSVDDNAMVIKAKNGTEIHLGSSSPGKEVALAQDTKDTVNDLISKLNQFITNYNAHTHPTPAGPSGPPAPQESSDQQTSASDYFDSGKIKGE